MESSLVEKVNYSKNRIVDLDLELSSKHYREYDDIGVDTFRGTRSWKFGNRVNFRCLETGIIVLTNFTDRKWDLVP